MTPRFNKFDVVYVFDYRSPAIVLKRFRFTKKLGLLRLHIKYSNKIVYHSFKNVSTLEKDDPAYNGPLCTYESDGVVTRIPYKNDRIWIGSAFRDPIEDPHFHVFLKEKDHCNWENGFTISLLDNRSVHHPGQNNSVIPKDAFDLVIQKIKGNNELNWKSLLKDWTLNETKPSGITTMNKMPNYNWETFISE